jgi:hypothetical protein
MIRPQYDQVDEEDRQAHIGSRSDILSKSFVTDLWMKVISRAVDDLVSIELLKKQNVALKEEDKEIEETATSFLFNDNHRIALDDYLVNVVCISCQWHSVHSMSEFSGHESVCPNCENLIDPRVCDYEITEQQVYKDISLRELLSVWEIDDITGFRNGVRERIKVLTEKKNTAALNRVRLKNERKEKMSLEEKQVPQIKEAESNFEIVTEAQLSDFDKGIIKVLDDIKIMLMAKNRKYGNSATNPVRAFSKADPKEQIKVRIDDKISRLVRSTSQEEDEDVSKDLIGYLVILDALNKGYIKY